MIMKIITVRFTNGCCSGREWARWATSPPPPATAWATTASSQAPTAPQAKEMVA